MTIEILKRGRLPETKRYRATCAHCKTEFSFRRLDARESGGQLDSILLVLPCPLKGCGKEVYCAP